MSIFGDQTITFISVEPVSEQDELGIRQLSGLQVVDDGTDVHGCRHRPLSPEGAEGGGLARAEQQAEINVSVATAWYQTTAPANDTTLAAKSSDVLRDENGDTYLIIGGIQVFPDFNGSPFKITILSEKQTIG